MPGRLVKLAGVPHHIHMTHVIAMPRVDHTAIRNQVQLTRLPSCP